MIKFRNIVPYKKNQNSFIKEIESASSITIFQHIFLTTFQFY